MDAALKQRLVGAAVLVALAVILLPMLVDGPEPQPGTAAVPLDIPPAPQRDFETRELPLAATVTSAPGPAIAADDPNRIVTIDAVNAPHVDALPDDTVVPGIDPTPATRPDNLPAPIQPPAPVATQPTPATAMGAAPATTPGGKFVVNLGSYANAANASALVSALKTAGLPAYADSTQLDAKPVQRVRLGPYAQRGEAEAARLAATRVRADLPAAVVALEAESAAAAPAPVRAAVASGFAVQIGALASEADANALRGRARGAGFTAFVERAATETGDLWRVRVGPELQRANAEKVKLALMQKLQIDGNIVTHP